MCVGREFFNLCKCGCSEAIHQSNMIEQIYLETFGGFGWTPPRGKCLGEVPTWLDLSPEQLKQRIEEAEARGEKLQLTKPCDCQKFDPVFKNECGGFGADSLLGKKL